MPTIQNIGISPVSFKLKQPFVTAAGRKTETHNVQVTLVLDDGTKGHAEASSSIAMPSESQVNLTRALKNLCPELIGQPIENYRDLIALSWRIQALHPTAASAMECAILDAYARTLKKPLSAFLGNTSVTVETDLTLSVGQPDELHDQAKEAFKKGFYRLKVKLAGSNPSEDIKRLEAVHKGAPRAALVADGNQGFGLSQASDFAHQLKRAQVPIVFLEQPFPKHDIRSMRLFRQRFHLPLMADESILTAADAVRIFEAEAADGVNIKIAKSGLLGALDIIHITQRFKKRLSIGCMEESKAGLAHSVHLACGTGVFEWVDLDSFLLLENPAKQGGFRVDGSKLSVKGVGPGTGV